MCQASVTEGSVVLPPVSGSATMTTAAEYRKFAEECLRWADNAKTAEEKKTFLDMAEIWVKAARAKETNGHAPILPLDDDSEATQH
jgi:hypothetical protein